MTVGRALRYIVEERVSNPIALMQQMEIELKELLEKELEPGLTVPIKAIVVFTHPAVEINVKGGPIPVCKIDKLKKKISTKTSKLAPKVYEKLSLFLEQMTLE